MTTPTGTKPLPKIPQAEPQDPPKAQNPSPHWWVGKGGKNYPDPGRDITGGRSTTPERIAKNDPQSNKIVQGTVTAAERLAYDFSQAAGVMRAALDRLAPGPESKPEPSRHWWVDSKSYQEPARKIAALVQPPGTLLERREREIARLRARGLDSFKM